MRFHTFSKTFEISWFWAGRNQTIVQSIIFELCQTML